MKDTEYKRNEIFFRISRYLYPTSYMSYIHFSYVGRSYISLECFNNVKKQSIFYDLLDDAGLIVTARILSLHTQCMFVE